MPEGRVSDRETRTGPVDPLNEVESEVELGGDVVVVVVEAVGGAAPAPVVDEPVVDCRLAMARTSPVFTSMTTAVPLNAWEAEISAASACSATYCTDWSMVSSTLVPGVELTAASAPPGSVTPSGAVRRLFDPALPARSDWYWYSSPDAPLPSQLTDPTTGEASRPLGSTRWVSAIRLMPGRLRAVTLAASGSGIRWTR